MGRASMIDLEIFHHITNRVGFKRVRCTYELSTGSSSGQRSPDPFFDALLEVVGLGTSLREQVLERVHIQNGEQVLDVGCGTAALLIRSKARAPGAPLVGVDADPHILALASKNIHQHG